MTTNFKKSLGILTLLLFLSVIAGTQNAFATAGDAPSAEENAAMEADAPNEAQGIKNKVTFRGDDYMRSNWPNMTRVFWRFDLPDINNDEDVDIFLQVNECDLYEKYYGDEFEWLPLRDVMRDYLKQNKESFNRRLYFDLPIEVGDYNVENGHFGVVSRQFNSGMRDFFPHPVYLGWNKEFCGTMRNDNRLKTVYPREGLFRLIRPINIPHVKVDEEIAKKLVRDWLDEEAEKRFLAIRMYITITKFVGFQDFRNKRSIPIYLAYVNGYEVYGNLNMEDLLYTKAYQKKVKKDANPSVNTNNSASNEEDYE